MFFFALTSSLAYLIEEEEEKMISMDEQVTASGDASDYFASYDNIAVHNLMLRDGPRVNAYRDAILASKAQFKDKV